MKTITDLLMAKQKHPPKFIKAAAGYSPTALKSGAVNGNGYFPLLDGVRAWAILLVILYHYLQEFFGAGFLMKADGIGANLQRLQVFQGEWSWLKNIAVGWFTYGFSAVNVFLILSGFLLTWGALKKPDEKDGWWNFFIKKGRRILIPFYFSVLIWVALLFFRNWAFPALSWWPNYSWLDYLKFFFPPVLLWDLKWLQQMDGDYWYIPLILQLYLLFPVLIWILRKAGIKKFLLTMFLLTVGYRFLASYGNMFLPWRIDFLDSAPMGVISGASNGYKGFGFFLPRLMEFSLGMALAKWNFRYAEKNPQKILNQLLGWKKFGLGAVLMLTGFTCNYYRPGWLISDPLMGLGLFTVLLNISVLMQHYLGKILKMISDCSFEIYLLHHYFLNFLMLPLLASFELRNEKGFWCFMPIYLVLVLLIGKAGNQASQILDRLINKMKPTQK